MQRARQYRELYDLIIKDHGGDVTLQTLATTVEEGTGNPESLKTIQHYPSLTAFEPETTEILACEKLSLRHGLEIARVKDSKEQVKLAKETRRDKLDINNLHCALKTSLSTSGRRGSGSASRRRPRSFGPME